MFLAVRTIVYATLFVGFLLVYLPARILAQSGIEHSPVVGGLQIAGLIVGALGALLALACVVSFVHFGRGTPAPFDAPRRLVVRGPYRFVRNPMYLGGALALGGAALYYDSTGLLAYTCAFLATFHLFVLFYEEPTLRRRFGTDYETYCRKVHRWWPALRPMKHHPPIVTQLTRPASRSHK